MKANLIKIADHVSKYKDSDSLATDMLKQEQVDCPVVHHFYPGIYMREVFFPAGTLAIGHAQRFDHLNIVLRGRVTMINLDGTTGEIVAPTIFMGQAGQKIGYINEDTVWLNAYPTTETDIEKLEATYLDKSDLWKSHLAEHKIDRVIDRIDFKEMVKEIGISEETIQAETDRDHDLIPFPNGSYSVSVSDSDIHGKGLFATKNYKVGEYIVPANINGYRTPAGRFTNHAKDPNAKMEVLGNTVMLIAITDIKGYRGGYLGDEITVDYRQVVRDV